MKKEKVNFKIVWKEVVKDEGERLEMWLLLLDVV